MRSREEDEELQRSTKKVKENHRNGAFGPEEMEGSYKAKLPGEIPRAYEQAFEFDREMDTGVESNDDISDLSRGMKAVNFSKETKVRIRAQWSSALIVKVFGKTVGYQYLHPWLLDMWRPVGKLDCVNLGKDFFLVRFSLKDDYVNVLKGGPWFVNDHYLSIRSWEPDFRPSSASISSMVVWIRLPELPIEYYEPSVLREISEAIGPVLRVDTHAAAEARGRFSRLCVQINFDEPIVKLLRIGGKDQVVLYEGINSLCFSCGCVGHKSESCPYYVRTPEKVGGKEGDERPMEKGDESKGDMANPQSQQEAQEDIFGPWVLVSQKKHMGKHTRKSSAQSSSFNDNKPRDTTPIRPLSSAELKFNIGKVNGNLDCGETSKPIPTCPIMLRNLSKSKDGSASQPNRHPSRGQKSKNASRDITSQKKNISNIPSGSKATQMNQTPNMQLEAQSSSIARGAKIVANLTPPIGNKMMDGSSSTLPPIVFEANPDSSRSLSMEMSKHLFDDSNSRVVIAVNNISKVSLHRRGSKSHLGGKGKLKQANQDDEGGDQSSDELISDQKEYRDRDNSPRLMDIFGLRGGAFGNGTKVDEMQFDEGKKSPTSC